MVLKKSEGLKQTLDSNIFPSTLQHLSISNCFPTTIPHTLISLTLTNHKPDQPLDLLQHHSLTKLSIYADRIIHYPPNLIDLTILNNTNDDNNLNLTFNRSNICKLSLKVKQFDTFINHGPPFPNLKHLVIQDEVEFNFDNIPHSVEVLDYRNGMLNQSSKIPSFFKETHISLRHNIVYGLSKPVNEEKFELVSPSTLIHLYIDSQSLELYLPLVDNIKS
ncbi:hypothetical protein CYY_000956 [Polysphondylium violaceum]|uniref:FNIP repeat-containing protein n=1 Tax=Polysphondylium violaceum TaxID=133409 RepID=A0A8J4Q3Y1_9MYCE|nr:hypothetical protein CYY_000956 [Polysphondylium violaceum]